MDEIELHVVIKDYFFKCRMAQETKAELNKYYGESAQFIRMFWLFSE